MFLFLFSLFSGEVHGSDVIHPSSHSEFVAELVIESPDREFSTHCSGLCLGRLSIWPSVKTGNIWPYGLNTSVCICL